MNEINPNTKEDDVPTLRYRNKTARLFVVKSSALLRARSVPNTVSRLQTKYKY